MEYHLLSHCNCLSPEQPWQRPYFEKYKSYIHSFTLKSFLLENDLEKVCDIYVFCNDQNALLDLVLYFYCYSYWNWNNKSRSLLSFPNRIVILLYCYLHLTTILIQGLRLHWFDFTQKLIVILFFNDNIVRINYPL